MTIGVFINPGHTADQKEASDADWGDRTTNRRVEYNALDDKYSKLIVDELLPVLKKEYNISDDPENRAISGASSGAICAFTVAWHRPDQFRKVISTIGSFTNIMGGHVYPDLIRQSERKPIRIFLQDGVNDNRGLRRGGQYDPNSGLARAEHQDGRGADGEEVRRELTPGASARIPTSRGVRSCPRCSAGSGAIIPGRTIRRTRAIEHCSFRETLRRGQPRRGLQPSRSSGRLIAMLAKRRNWSRATALPGSRSTSYADLDGDSEFDFRVKIGPGLQESSILYNEGWVKVGNSKTKTRVGTICHALDGRKFRFENGKWKLLTD